MKNDFVLAFNEVLEEKQLPKTVILEALEAAMVSAYRRAVNASNAQEVKAAVDPESGKVSIYAEKEVVDSVQDPRTEVSLADAQKVDPNAELGAMVVVESTPRDFGRVAAQTARQVIQQRIREAERDSQLSHYSKQMNEIVSGVVQAVGPTGATLGLDMKAEGTMPRKEMIPGERFHVHDRVRALLMEVKHTPRGPQIILSRAHRNFLRRLLENEVPEIYHGLVEIRSISREPGQRSKVAVAALQAGIDPVGACVGIRGVRIQAIVRELNDEKIDVIEWNADPAIYIAKALSPARVTGVYLNEHAKGAKTATVVVPEDQLSLAIGRDGQNARLAAKLTSWRIDIKSLPEAATDALYKLQNNPDYAFMIPSETENIPQIEVILAKKAENRPVTPEEYTVLSQFVDRLERGLIRQRQAEVKAREERQKMARAAVPQAAFDLTLDQLGLSDRIFTIISEAGYETVGDLKYQMSTDSDVILKLSGIGPKAIKEIEEALDKVVLPEPAPVETVAEEVQVEAPETEPVTAEAAEAGEARAAIEATTEEGQPSAVGAAEPVVEAPAEEVQAGEVVEEEASAKQAAAKQAAAEEATVEPVSAAEAETPEAAAPAEVEEEPTTLDELFALKPDAFQQVDVEEDEEDEEGQSGKKKDKKKKKKYVEIEYDPDSDSMVVKKKRKRGAAPWEDTWE